MNIVDEIKDNEEIKNDEEPEKNLLPKTTNVSPKMEEEITGEENGDMKSRSSSVHSNESGDDSSSDDSDNESSSSSSTSTSDSSSSSDEGDTKSSRPKESPLFDTFRKASILFMD